MNGKVKWYAVTVITIQSRGWRTYSTVATRCHTRLRRITKTEINTLQVLFSSTTALGQTPMIFSGLLLSSSVLWLLSFRLYLQSIRHHARAPASMSSFKKCIPISDNVDTVAVVANPESSMASINNSKRATHAMAPPAKPKPAGRMGMKW